MTLTTKRLLDIIKKSCPELLPELDNAFNERLEAEERMLKIRAEAATLTPEQRTAFLRANPDSAYLFNGDPSPAEIETKFDDEMILRMLGGSISKEDLKLMLNDEYMEHN